MMALRTVIGAPASLNARPLIWGLREKLAKDSLVLDTPAAIAEMLRRGSLEIGLVPSIDYLRNPDYEMLPDVCVASNGPFMSVILICRKPPALIETVALDTSSPGAMVLCRIILQKLYSISPAYIDWSPTVPLESVNAEAFMVAGDSALQMWPRYDHIIDLSEEWRRLTELPFVHEVWAGPAIRPSVGRLLRDARDQGLRHLSRIGWQEAERLDLPSGICLDHLTNRVYYSFGENEREGLARFQHYAAEMNLCPSEAEREVPMVGI